MIIAVIAMDWPQSHMRPVGIPYRCYTINAITVARFWQEVLFLIGARVNGDITLGIVLVSSTTRCQVLCVLLCLSLARDV